MSFRTYILLKKKLNLIYFIFSYIKAEDFVFIKVLYLLFFLNKWEFYKGHIIGISGFIGVFPL